MVSSSNASFTATQIGSPGKVQLAYLKLQVGGRLLGRSSGGRGTASRL